MTNAPAQYRPAQIILHWVVVLGILVQWLFNGPIVSVIEARQTGAELDGSATTMAWFHVSVGSIILIAVIARLYLRKRYGVPDHAPGTSDIQAKIASGVHWSLYGLLLAMVLTGMLTWNGIAPLGSAHFVINTLIFFVALLHVAAALFNQFVRKDGTLRRMMLSPKG